jgi:hypothetical protein
MAEPHEVDAWLARLRRFWSARVDALERLLDRIDDRLDDRTGQLGNAIGGSLVRRSNGHRPEGREKDR